MRVSIWKFRYEFDCQENLNDFGEFLWTDRGRAYAHEAMICQSCYLAL